MITTHPFGRAKELRRAASTRMTDSADSQRTHERETDRCDNWDHVQRDDRLLQLLSGTQAAGVAP
jgi:hypothetical protein